MFSIIHFNARSLYKNFEDISIFLSSLKHSFTIIAVSETWISRDPVIPFNLPGYIHLFIMIEHLGVEEVLDSL